MIKVILKQGIVAIFLIIALTNLHAATVTNHADMQILSLSDIHFDPYTACAGKMPCPLIQQLSAAPASQWPSILAKNDASHPEYREDSDYSLLASALTAAKGAAQKNNVKAVLVLGDFLGHEYRHSYRKFSGDGSREAYRRFVNKTMTFVTNEIGRTFPNINVYAVVGNNDSYRGDYRIEPNGTFFSDTGNLFASLIKDPANKAALRAEFHKAGYYAVTIAPDTRLVVMNTVLFSSKAKPKEADVSAEQQLIWLHKQLASAKENHQRVMIAMHIPAGVDVYGTLKFRFFRLIEFWNHHYTEKFEAELIEFSPEVVAIFAGHLHADWFQRIQLDNRNSILVTGTPSISPIFGNNPAFKIYQYSPASGELTNFETYYFPLDKREWSEEYSFNKVYQPDCNHCNLHDGIERLTASNQLASHYKHFYSVSTTSQPITTKWLPYYWCATQNVTADKYKKCVA